jgi:HPt (histidine-containing phosphotransfer) domain-containing protein
LRIDRVQREEIAVNCHAASIPLPPVVDRTALLARVEGDTGLLRALVDLFAHECPQRVEAIRVAVDREDSQELERAAHYLKGALLLFDAKGVVDAARRLEYFGRTRKLVGAREVFDRLQRETQRLLVELAEYCD